MINNSFVSHILNSCDHNGQLLPENDVHSAAVTVLIDWEIGHMHSSNTRSTSSRGQFPDLSGWENEHKAFMNKGRERGRSHEQP